ncbi:hypothetical protein RDI58_022025 [Solanum bulbocastanum]|uniref:Uncharacterized protein n=1 Tax=Solanum bulbocastanum TaxID=147425 RepID=A0AAN8T9T9_SOLBU
MRSVFYINLIYLNCHPKDDLFMQTILRKLIKLNQNISQFCFLYLIEKKKYCYLFILLIPTSRGRFLL